MSCDIAEFTFVHLTTLQKSKNKQKIINTTQEKSQVPSTKPQIDCGFLLNNKDQEGKTIYKELRENISLKLCAQKTSYQEWEPNK